MSIVEINQLAAAGLGATIAIVMMFAYRFSQGHIED